jgi:hypothetical protein
MRQKTWKGKVIEPGEPDVLKGTRPVREGLVGNAITTVWMWRTRADQLLHSPAPMGKLEAKTVAKQKLSLSPT